jgi:citrate lyase subunit beta/citryl-CoA lyase
MTGGASLPRLRRSVLYVPGFNPRAMDKAKTLEADAIILDLEDAVAPEAKTAARGLVLQALRAGGFGRREVAIRVNGLDTPWGADDLVAVAASGADAVLLPKITGPQEVCEALRRVDAGGGASLQAWVMAETPQAVLAMDSIASLAPRVTVIVMGTADLAKCLRVPPQPPRAGLVTALSLCVLAARARGLDILDGIFTDLRDEPGFREACLQGKALGFDGKTLIHPAQIALANEIFGVSAAQAAEAARIVAAWESATATGKGIAMLDGRMVERLHAEEARRLLALHEALRGAP